MSCCLCVPQQCGHVEVHTYCQQHGGFYQASSQQQANRPRPELQQLLEQQSYKAQQQGGATQVQYVQQQAIDIHSTCRAQIEELQKNLARGLEDAFRDRDLWLKRAEDLDTKLADTRTALSNLLETFLDNMMQLREELELWPTVIEARAILTNGIPTKKGTTT